MPWQPNPGRLPADCVVRDAEAGEITGYRKVHVRLFNGIDTRRRGDAPWPAAGARLATEWRISTPPGPFEIEAYEIA